jgi:hypothetical protein
MKKETDTVEELSTSIKSVTEFEENLGWSWGNFIPLTPDCSSLIRFEYLLSTKRAKIPGAIRQRLARNRNRPLGLRRGRLMNMNMIVVVVIIIIIIIIIITKYWPTLPE